MTSPNVVAITGASGFLGLQLANALKRRADIQIRALARNAPIVPLEHENKLMFVRGDLTEPSVLAELLRPGCSVAHFAYDAAASGHENLAATEALAEACARHGVKRLLHCSTAVVVGSTHNAHIDESTECHPGTAYENAKLAIEDLLRKKSSGKFEFVVLRPTAVFGPGGRNLLKMADDLAHGSRLKNQLRSFVNGARRLNLVAVENVIAAVIYLLEADSVDREIFVISDDEDPGNNFYDVESYLMGQLGIPAYPVHLALPEWILSLLLHLRGRSLVNPRSRFSCEKLRQHGFKKPAGFESALSAFVAWYKATHRTSMGSA